MGSVKYYRFSMYGVGLNKVVAYTVQYFTVQLGSVASDIVISV